MHDSPSQSGWEDVTSLSDQTIGRSLVVSATRDDGRGKRASPGWQAAEVPGQAAARGQFALFDKGRALARWYQRHGAGSKGQGADRATAPRYRFSVIGCTGDTPASTGFGRIKRRTSNIKLPVL